MKKSGCYFFVIGLVVGENSCSWGGWSFGKGIWCEGRRVEEVDYMVRRGYFEGFYLWSGLIFRGDV